MHFLVCSQARYHTTEVVLYCPIIPYKEFTCRVIVPVSDNKLHRLFSRSGSGDELHSVQTDLGFLDSYKESSQETFDTEL